MSNVGSDMSNYRERFVDRIMWTESCWIWTGTTLPAGYGVMWFEGRQLLSHRIAWTVYRGPIPQGMQVLHKCDNPCCVNPAHLFLGTQHDNMHDMIRKNRSKLGKSQHTQVKGVVTPRHATSEGRKYTKVSDEQVAEIRQKYFSGYGTQQALADEYGITRSRVGELVRNEGRLPASPPIMAQRATI